jgi:hypothetical protein
MKPTAQPLFERRLARHDPRAWNRRAFLATYYFLRSPADAALVQTRSRTGESPSRAFRQMTAQMLENENRREPLELIAFALITAIIAWPLISLLIVLAQTANG